MVTDGALDGAGIRGAGVGEALAQVKDIPDDSAKAMGDSPDGFGVSEPDEQATEDRWQVSAVGSDSGLCGLA